MVAIYVNLIRQKQIELSDVPTAWRELVRQELED